MEELGSGAKSGNGAGGGPQVPEEEANRKVEQQEPRLQRPCVDDDPW